MAEPDAIAHAVLGELERRRGGDDELSVRALSEKAGLGQQEVDFWLRGERNLRSDKVAMILKTLGMVIVRGGLVRKTGAKARRKTAG